LKVTLCKEPNIATGTENVKQGWVDINIWSSGAMSVEFIEAVRNNVFVARIKTKILFASSPGAWKMIFDILEEKHKNKKQRCHEGCIV
jgi:hypothetical protein